METESRIEQAKANIAYIAGAKTSLNTLLDEVIAKSPWPLDWSDKGIAREYIEQMVDEMFAFVSDADKDIVDEANKSASVSRIRELSLVGM